ncbi:MAG: hypothetical protein KDK70_34850 [Myxococcales bacterium]|nr:hypothetical protein [Myxococcales bacterium]
MWGLPDLPLPTAVGSSALPDQATRLRFIAAVLQGVGPPTPGSQSDRILAVLAGSALAA